MIGWNFQHKPWRRGLASMKYALGSGRGSNLRPWAQVANASCLTHDIGHVWTSCHFPTPCHRTVLPIWISGSLCSQTAYHFQFFSVMADRSILNNKLLIYQFEIGKLIYRLDKLALIIISKVLVITNNFLNIKVVRIEIGK